MSNYSSSPGGGGYGGGGGGYNNRGRGYNNGGGGGYRGGRGGFNQNNNYNKRGREDDWDSQGGGGQRRRNDYYSSPGGGSRGFNRGPLPPLNNQPQISSAQSFKNHLYTLAASTSPTSSTSTTPAPPPPTYTAQTSIPLFGLATQLRFEEDPDSVKEGFRVAVTRLLPRQSDYAALIGWLCVNKPRGHGAPKGPKQEAFTAPKMFAGREIKGLPSRPALPTRPEEPTADAEPEEENEKEREDEITAKEGEGEDVEMAPAEKEVEKSIGRHLIEDLGAFLQRCVDTDRWVDARNLIKFLLLLPPILPSHFPPFSSYTTTLLTPFYDLVSPTITTNSLSFSKSVTLIRLVGEALLVAIGEGVAIEGDVQEMIRGLVNTVESERDRGRREDVEKGINDSLTSTAKEVNDNITSLLATLSSILTSHSSPPFKPLFISPFPSLPPPPSTLPTAPTTSDDPSSSTDPSSPQPDEIIEPEPEHISAPVIILDKEGRKILKFVSKPASEGLRGDEGVGEEGVRVKLRLFEDDTVPSLDSAPGLLLQSLFQDLLSIYEINRKESSSILLSIPSHVRSGLFPAKDAEKSSSSTRAEKERGRERDEEEEFEDEDVETGKENWVVENCVVEGILSSLFALPTSDLPASYYHALLCELCRLSPTTVAPALGKCVRKLFNSLGSKDEASPSLLGPEGLRRFADWWSVHLSNFGFMWAWGEWAPQLPSLPSKHPKRIAVERIIELEVRLSYYDRVLGTLPQSLLDCSVIPSEAPTMNYAFSPDSPSAHPEAHKTFATSLLALIRGKSGIEEIESKLEEFAKELEVVEGLEEEQAKKIGRECLVQGVLNVGSRSFSHFLNVLERYLSLLRDITRNSTTRLEFLHTLSSFWLHNSQFHLIVLDKLLQYRLVTSVDVLAWVFAPNEDKWASWGNVDRWNVVKMTVGFVKNRLAATKRAVEEKKRREEREKLKEKAEREGTTEKADGEDVILADADQPEEPEAEHEEEDTTLNPLETATQDLTSTIIEIIKQFSSHLELAAQKVDEDEWELWWTEGWFREFCRSLATDGLLAQPAVVMGIEELTLDDKSSAVKTLDAAKAWTEFV